MKITWRFCKSDMELRKFRKKKGDAKFSQCCKGDVKFSQVKKVMRNFHKWKRWLRNFRKWWKVVAKISSVLRIFRKWLWNSSVLDSSSDSLPYTLDWFGKGFEALQNLDSSCNLASILLCHGLCQVFPHSWLVLMIKKLLKTSKLAKN